MKPKTAAEYEIYTFEFDDNLLSDDETLLASYVMFAQLGYTELFHVNEEVRALHTL